MAPRLGEKYDVEIETVSKPREEYKTQEYAATNQPVAPAIVVGDELVVQGKDVEEHQVEEAICRHLGLEPPQPEKKGILGRFLGS